MYNVSCNVHTRDDLTRLVSIECDMPLCCNVIYTADSKSGAEQRLRKVDETFDCRAQFSGCSPGFVVVHETQPSKCSTFQNTSKKKSPVLESAVMCDVT